MRRARRNRIDRHGGGIERLALQVPWLGDLAALVETKRKKSIWVRGGGADKGAAKKQAGPPEPSYAVNRVLATPVVRTAKQIQLDLQRVFRLARALPSKRDMFFKELNKLRNGFLTFGMASIFDGEVVSTLAQIADKGIAESRPSATSSSRVVNRTAETRGLILQDTLRQCGASGDAATRIDDTLKPKPAPAPSKVVVKEEPVVRSTTPPPVVGVGSVKVERVKAERVRDRERGGLAPAAVKAEPGVRAEVPGAASPDVLAAATPAVQRGLVTIKPELGVRQVPKIGKALKAAKSGAAHVPSPTPASTPSATATATAPAPPAGRKPSPKGWMSREARLAATAAKSAHVAREGGVQSVAFVPPQRKPQPPEQQQQQQQHHHTNATAPPPSSPPAVASSVAGPGPGGRVGDTGGGGQAHATLHLPRHLADVQQGSYVCARGYTKHGWWPLSGFRRPVSTYGTPPSYVRHAPFGRASYTGRR